TVPDEAGARHICVPAKKETSVRTSLLAATAALLVLLVGGNAPAQQGFREDRARVILKEAIRTGAPLYNRGDAGGCYLVYRGALQSVLPLLRDHPRLRANISASLQRAVGQRSFDARAW